MATTQSEASEAGQPGQPVFRRHHTSTTVDGDSSPATAVTSPLESPRASASSTSLSSLSSIDLPGSSKAGRVKLVDTYGNEFQPPNYTIKEIRDAIPKHCFQRSALLGYAYIVRDLVCLATTFAVFHNLVTPETVPSTAARGILWGVYALLQGLFATGVWVIAHECGHGAFSEYQWLNNLTGWVLHSALLVPFFSWQISHGKHHKATGHMERDMVFVPRTRETHATRVGRLVHELSEVSEDAPIRTLLELVGQQVLGWPNYLLTNVTGHNFHHRQSEGRGKGKRNGLFGGVSHFSPASPIFENKHAKLIVLSDVGVGLAIAGLVALGRTFGWQNMLVWYGLPYLWVNHWLVAITFLQHTDPSLPHYTADTWDFVRGAAATIDREMGFVGRHLLHGIVETHVLHHYDSKIPFYHADEASDAIRAVMGRHYRSDTEGGLFGFIRALWRSGRMCQWVEPSEGATGADKGILFFRNRNGVGTKPLKMGQ